jgi:uncharacterized protein
VASLYYDLGEVGEMHHDPAKNVLFVRAGTAEISARSGIEPDRVRELLDAARAKMYTARRQRPTPFVDKTVYVSWNALCISAYLESARALELPNVGRFALRSLDRILSEGWDDKTGLKHVIAYSDMKSAKRDLRGMLDDYCFMVSACLDAYEFSADITYFRFAAKIADLMMGKFCDRTSGGFFDTPQSIFDLDSTLGALVARRKPFQDTPTPAGNPAAAIALLRLFHYTNDAGYRDVGEQTLETFAGVAEQTGIFGATYGLATLRFVLPSVQVVVVGEGAQADALAHAAAVPYAVNKSMVRLTSSQVVAANLPPALAETIPNLPGIKDGKPMAVLCSGFACQPPIHTAEELTRALKQALSPKP